MVRTGFYKLTYGGSTGSGFGMLALWRGGVAGIDEAGVEYEGEYGEDLVTGAVQLRVTAKVPANVALVLGTPPKPEAWSFVVEALLPPGFATGAPVKLRTKFGSVNISFSLLRALDEQLPEGA